MNRPCTLPAHYRRVVAGRSNHASQRRRRHAVDVRVMLDVMMSVGVAVDAGVVVLV